MSITQTITDLLMRARTEGYDKAAADMNAVAGAEEKLIVARESDTKATLNLERQTVALQKSLDAAYRSELQMEATEKKITAAREAGLISIQRQNELMALASAKYREVGESAKVMAEGMATAKEVAMGLVAGLGAGLLLTGLAEIPAKVREAVESAAKLKELSETLDITTKNLQELQYAAGQSGISTETLNSALEKFSKNLGQAAGGAGTLFKILQANHVVITGDLTKDFENYIELLQHAQNAEQKNALAAAGFGKTAQEMGRLANEGAAGVRKLADDANAAGAVLGGDTLDGAKALNDEFVSLQAQLNVAFEGFMINIAPPILLVLAAITAAVKLANDVIEATKWGTEQALPIADRSTAHLEADLAQQQALLKKAAGGGGTFGTDASGRIVNTQPMRISVSGTATAAARATAAAEESELGNRAAATIGTFMDKNTSNGGWGTLGKPTVLPGPGGGATKADPYDSLITGAKNATAALEAQRMALTQTAGQTAYLTEKTALLNKAEAAHIELSPKQRREIDAEAKSYAAATVKLKGMQETMADQSPWDTMEASLKRQKELLDAGAISWGTYNQEAAKAADTMVNSYGNAASNVLDNLSTLTTAMGLQGQQAFDVQKGLSIARAVVAGGEAIANSYAAGSVLGPAGGAISAGIAAIAAAANIAAIASTTYSSTSLSGGGSGGGGSIPQAPAAAPAAQAGPSISVQLIGGGSYSRDQIVTLIGAINDATNNGAAKINIGKAA
jgi:hypothetical protein